MNDNLGSGTARGLIDYLDSLVSKGRARSGNVLPLKTALVKILEKTEGDNWENVDVTKLDINDAVNRFKNLTLGNYTDDSYRAYAIRAKRAIGWYQNFLQNPGWFPKESARTPKAPSDNGVKSEVGGKVSEVSRSNAPERPRTQMLSITEAPRIDAIAYPFPLANGETARIYMPKGITKADVRRLSSFLEALVIESEE